MANGYKPDLTYYFTLKPKIQSVPIGETPDGFRIDLRYTSGEGDVISTEVEYNGAWRQWLNDKVNNNVDPPGWAALQDNTKLLLVKSTEHFFNALKTDAAELKDARNRGFLEWFGIKGTVLSGGDWATVREDGVGIFDGRITIKSDDGFLVDAVITGVVDFRKHSADHLPSPESPEPSYEIFTKWRSGKLTNRNVRIALPIRFEAANYTKNWADQKLKDASKGFWKYERLVRGQFIASGVMDLAELSYSPISDIELHVYEVGSFI
jgi:hypothetical protein